MLVGVSGPGGQDEARQTRIASGAQILARGGGHIETSGKRLKLGQALIDAGIGGSWLTDPTDLTINATAATTIDAALAAGTSVTEQTTSSGGITGAGTEAVGNGDINVASALSWSTSATLTLDAFHDINVDAPITVGGGGQLVLTARNGITVSNAITVSTNGGLAFTTNSGNANPNATLAFAMGQGSATFATEADSPTLSINGTSYRLVYSEAEFDAMGSGDVALAAPLTFTTSYGNTVPVSFFSGNFNGLGNTIGGLSINGDNNAGGSTGLFGFVYGTISNIGLIDPVVNSTGGFLVMGALVGTLNGTVFNSYAASSTTSVTSSRGDATVGGLVGEVNSGSIKNSYASIFVNATGSIDPHSPIPALGAGGLVGGVRSGAALVDDYATGKVTYSGSGGIAGGLVGTVLSGGTITNAYATGVVTGPTVGGVAGTNAGTITNGYFDTTTMGDINAAGGGSGSVSGGGGVSTSDLAGATVLAELNGNGAWANLANQTTPYLLSNPGAVFLGTDGSATPLAYNLVFTPTQLQAIASSGTTLAGNYALAQDIDMTGVADFTPIGDFTTMFSGTFDGLGNVVANLTINSTANAVGLFGVLDPGGHILNTGTVGGSVTGPADAHEGGLVGENRGTIESSYSTAAVNGPSSGSNLLGGLVGLNAGTIDGAYATGAVSGNVTSAAGGLAGSNTRTISDAYATGAVNAGQAGGLVGANSGVISNVYAAGMVTGTATTTGGLIGLNDLPVTNGYWDTDRSPSGTPGVGTASSSSVGVTGLSGAAPFTTSSYGSCGGDSFCFSSTPGETGNAWVIVDTDGSLNNAGGAGATMPMLAFEAQSTIQNAHQLQLLAMNPLSSTLGTLSGSYTLGTDIDATATGSSTSAATGTDVWTTTGFVPLGQVGVSSFAGTLDGGGKTISNLTVNSSQFAAGLTLTLSGTVENLGLVGGLITDNTVNAVVGGFTGANVGTLGNVYSTASVSGAATESIGGLAGSNLSAGMITQSFAAGAVTGGQDSSVGGLVGVNAGTVTQSFAAGPVSGNGSTLGGLIGQMANGTVTDVYATGSVTSSSAGQAAGLIGVVVGGSIADAYATGTVTGTTGLNATQVGGLTFSNVTVIDGYWDTETTGQPTSGSGTPMTTAELQDGLPTGFVNPIWGTGAAGGAKTYPYLCWQAAGCLATPQVVSGTVYQDQAGMTNAGPGISVSALVNGAALNSVLTGGTVTTGANGYYYYLVAPNTIAPGGGVFTYAQNYTAGAGTASGAAFVDGVTAGAATGMTILANTLHEITPDGANSALQTNLVTAVGSDATGLSLLASLSNLQIDASATSFDVDSAISYASPGGTVTLNAAGAITESTGMIAADELAISAAGSVDLPGGNLVNTLAANVTGTGGTFAFSNAQSLTIGTVGSLAGVTTDGTDGSAANIVLRTTAGDLDIEEPVSTNGTINGASLGASLGMIGLQSAGDLTMNTGGFDGALVGSAVEAIADGIISLDGSFSLTGNRIGGNDSGDGVALIAGTFAAETTSAGATLVFNTTNAPLTIGQVAVTAGSIALPSLSGVTSNGGEIDLSSLISFFVPSETFALTLNEPVSANNFLGGNPTTVLQGTPGPVRLVAQGGDLTQSTNGVILAGQLYAEADGGPNYLTAPGGDVVLAAANRIGAADSGGIAQDAGLVAGFANGDFKFINNNAPLTIDTLSCGCGGVFTQFGDIDLATTGAGEIMVNKPLNAGTDINIAVAPGYGFTNTARNNHSFDFENGIGFTFGLDTTASGGSVTILADQMSLTSGTIGAGILILAPATQTDGIVLGAAGSAGTLGLQQADLDTIVAGAIQIGYRKPDGTASFTGDITIAGDITLDADNIAGLLLVTGGSVTETGGAIGSTGGFPLELGIIASGANSLTGANNVGILAAYIDGTNPSLSFTNNALLAVLGLDGPQAGVGFDSNGFPDPVPMTGAPSNPLSGITNSSGPVTLTTTGALSELLLIAPITASSGVVTLASDAGIVQFPGAPITAMGLSVTAAGSVDLAADNLVGTLAANVTGAGATFDFSNAQDLTIGTVGSLVGVTTNGTDGSEANVVLRTTAGDLFINTPVSTNGPNGAVLGASIGEIGLLASGSIVQDQSSGDGYLVGAAVEAFAGTSINLDPTTSPFFTGLGNRIGGNDMGGLAQTPGIVSAKVTGAGGSLSFSDMDAPLTIDRISDGPSEGVAAGSLSLKVVSGIVANAGDISIAAFPSGGFSGTPLTVNAQVNANEFVSGSPSTVLQNNPGTISLISGGGDLMQSASGVIVGGELYAEAYGGSVLLTAATNRIGARDNGLGIAQTAGIVGGFADGNFELVDNDAPMAIKVLSCTCRGIFTTSGDIDLATAGAGDILVNKPLHAGQNINIAVAPGYKFTNSAINDGSFDTENGIRFTAGLDTSATGGLIVILADQMSLSTGTIRTERNGDTAGGVVLAPATPTDGIILGDAGSPGFLGLRSADLTAIKAGFVQIGYRNPDGSPSLTSNITIAGDITLDTDNIEGFLLVTGGSVTETGSAIGATGPFPLELGIIASGANSLTGANEIGTLAAYIDGTNPSLALTNAGAMTIGTLGGLDAGLGFDGNGFPAPVPMAGAPSNPLGGVTTTGGPVTLVTNSGDLTLASGTTVSGTDVVLATPAAFVNDAGSGAVSATSGRWLIYSAAPGGDTFGNLDSGDAAVWNATYASLPPADVTQGGNRYLFAQGQTLTVTTTSDTKTYGADVTAAVANDYMIGGYAVGVLNAFLGDSALTAYAGTPAVTSAGSAVTATVAGAPYQITATAGSMTGLDGYTLAFANNGQLSVTPATLTAGLTGTAARVYDGTTTAPLAAGNYTLTGILNGDSVSLNDPTSGIYATADVGTGIGVAATGLALTGSAAGNYTLASTTANAAIGTITPAILTAAITGNPTKVYDGTTTAPLASANFALTGFAAGQGATVAALDGAFATANAGTGIGVSATLASGNFTANPGTSLGNYTLPTGAAGTGTITAKTLTAGLTGTVGKVYDGTNAATLTAGNYTLSGVIGTDDVGLNDPTSGTYGQTGVGTGLTVNVGGLALTGAGVGNYTVANTVGGAVGRITAKTLTAGLTGPVGKVYDGTNVATLTASNYTLSGVIGSDDVGLNDPTSGTYGQTGVGTGLTVNVGGLALTGAGAGNYTVANTVGGAVGTITVRPITVAADDLSRSYGQPNPPLTFGVTSGSLVGGDALTGALATAATADSAAGPYPITEGTLAASANYTVTFVDGTLTIQPASGTVTPGITTTVNFGVSPNQYLPPAFIPPASGNGPSPCSSAGIANLLQTQGTATLFGPAGAVCGGL